MARVPLTRGKFALVDEADLGLVRQFNWHAAPRSHGGLFSACSGRGGKNPTAHGRLYMHNLIMCPPPGFEVDHINGDPLDNRRSNLRIATRSQNLANRQCDNGTGYRGVSRHGTRFVARIWKAGKKRHLGVFGTAEEAARAFDAAAVEIHGDFARLNFPPMRKAA